MSTDHHHDHGAQDDERRRFVAPDSSRRHHPAPDADEARLAELYDAALDDCRPCQERLLALVAQDAHATADLVNWACVITGETYGEIPDAVLEDDREDLFPEPFRQLAGTYQDHFMACTDYEAMLPQCSAMTDGQRRQAAAAAVALVVGLSDFGIDFPFQ
ncbi:hypothetical protein [Streptomyces noursei]|uniref:hypothetical protein n=1 Tax=Streptomyces noursei TaxID=1971 RepID=UPI00167AA4FC|nr:hypothetical protein [Streptomyces noursei]MCZ1021099.1 hypothetical protein [Streptomyces noursei]MCZ1021130.1 hypothetical protein [Streptomyces noursei]MCZ1021475.1 hypothetical protein [Streptomyces noursei]GGX51519.1 hypothetical protein GCM10010341_86280 [Streptomyces noursei]